MFARITVALGLTSMMGIGAIVGGMAYAKVFETVTGRSLGNI